VTHRNRSSNGSQSNQIEYGGGIVAGNTRKMRAVQVTKAKGPFEMIERDIPKPGSGDVRIKVQACGVCHSDTVTKDGLLSGIQYPRVPGHEVAGVIDTLGEGVKGWKVGDRVGVGWFGGSCGYCDSCRRGDFIVCLNTREVTGVTRDGGYAEYMIAHAASLVLVPDDITPVDAAPLMCAGVTTFNALRRSGAGPGQVVAILGVGGLGHLGVQFAAKMGFKTVAIARGADKEGSVKKLGAHVYIDGEKQDVAKELQKLGGARVIAATVTSGQAMTDALGGLGIDGELLILGAADAPIQLNPLQMLFNRSATRGCSSGSSIDSQDTVAFSSLTGVRPMTEVFPLEKYQEAYDRMLSAKVRFRAVLTTGQ
jgi:D-arabinose 1-dehydrogenase-like Zn-dependent alcohol dehydrogenase